MPRHEITHSVVEVKRGCDRDGGEDDADQPIKNNALFHK